jgi:2-polyprenyl-3-methyl-5-hydroxy-6-metoxy-1,4-benzoquinol methylase
MPVCEICASSSFTQIADRIREGEGRILSCDQCGLVIQDLNWNDERLRGYYESEYQKTNSLVSGRALSAREHFEIRLGSIEPSYEQIVPLVHPGMSVLEVGCGSGALLSLLKPHAKRLVGVELNHEFVEFINNELDIEAHYGDINTLGLSEHFDVVMCVDTLDHLPNPFQTVQSMIRLLAPGGVLYLEVPNLDDALNLYLPQPNRQAYQTFFWHRAHLFYFNQQSVQALLRKAGLDSHVTCRHNYTLKNYLNWYFRGSPQGSFLAGTTETGLFTEDSPFEQGMNALFQQMEAKFRILMSETFRGDCLSVTATRPSTTACSGGAA